jgi:hypothetical protein
MVCRHSKDDPNCSSHPDYIDYNQYVSSYQPPNSPDKSQYEIEDNEVVGNHLVLKVKYPNCSSCAYEGNKVMVFLNMPIANVLKWKEIDPHFRDPKISVSKTQAPSPNARFPGSKEGWEDAIEYARSKLHLNESKSNYRKIDYK